MDVYFLRLCCFAVITWIVFSVTVPQQVERAAERQAESAEGGADGAAGGDGEHRPAHLRAAGEAAEEAGGQQATGCADHDQAASCQVSTSSVVVEP